MLVPRKAKDVTDGAKSLIDSLKVRIFADGADPAEMRTLAQEPLIKGFTTNPTLMRKAGVNNYETFARQAIKAVPDLLISFEVFADDPDGMLSQALKIAAWGDNVYVKIPITNTKGESMVPVMRRLAGEGVKINATAMMTTAQVEAVADALRQSPPALLSLFAGRIADSGRDPCAAVNESLAIIEGAPQLELLWASPRQVYDIVLADRTGCHVITVTYDLLSKLRLFGKDLDAYSLETVSMFYEDARRAGYDL